MRVDTMRRIDLWVGRPLAALLTGLQRLAHRFKPPRQPAEIKRILFIELSEMGSTIIADPAMRRARELYPQAELYFLIFAKNRASLDILGTVARERTITIDSDDFRGLTLSTVAALWRIRRSRIDLVIDLELFSRFSSLLSLLSGAPLRVGFHRFHNEGLYRGNHLTHPVQYNPHQHMAKNFLALVHAAAEGSAVMPHTKRRFTDQETRLTPYQADPARRAALRQRLIQAYPALAGAGKWVILNPNASELMPLRKWPLEQFGALAERLLRDADVAVLITGAASEKPDAEAIARRAANGRLADLTGFTRLDELPLLYTLATAMVTNDSGPAHFAAPTGLKTYVLFGPETPLLYGALNPNAEFFFKGLACSPCVSAANHRKSPCTDNQCMKQIEVGEVYDRVGSFLGSAQRIGP
jgi:ADP-heptose:LPS heptosyltransferase